MGRCNGALFSVCERSLDGGIGTEGRESKVGAETGDRKEERSEETDLELKELTDRTLKLFGVIAPEQLGPALLSACDDSDKLRSFCELVDNDLSTDWMQKIYQYYLADRKVKKQDYTPASLAQFMGLLAGNSNDIVDMCAGSGALIIQKWSQKPDTRFTALEIDENVIPFLLFNMVLRNIQCRVFQMDALSGEDAVRAWNVTKGEEFGRITDIKPAV